LLAFLYWLNALNVSLTLSTNQFIQLWKIWICFCRLRMIIERRTSKRNEPVAVMHIERRIDVSLLKLLLPVIVIETVCLSLLCHSDWADASNPKLYAIKKKKLYAIKSIDLWIIKKAGLKPPLPPSLCCILRLVKNLHYSKSVAHTTCMFALQFQTSYLLIIMTVICQFQSSRSAK
jgi:hypothetical protein